MLHSAGKVGGALPEVKENLGLGLLSQAGVAIGLVVDSCKRFSILGPGGETLGPMILGAITATTFIVRIFGPIGVKRAIHRAGEAGQAALDHDGWASEGKHD